MPTPRPSTHRLPKPEVAVDPSPSATWEERQQFDAASIDRASLVRLFPEFRIHEMVSRGGYGAIYFAEYRKTKQAVAFKTLSKTPGTDEHAQAKFQADLDTVGTLAHPGVAKVLVIGERNGILFLAQEWVEGVDLEKLVSSAGPLRPADAVEIIRQAFEVLEVAYAKGLQHRELKPTNLLLTAGGAEGPRVRVIDLGFARLTEGVAAGFKMNMSGKFRGPIDYIAPEQVEQPRNVDIRADIYGLGATLYKLLTGCAPHQGEDAEESMYQKILRITREDPVPLNQRNPSVSPALAAVVHRLMARDPAARPATPAEAKAALEPFALGSSLATVWAAAPKKPPVSQTLAAKTEVVPGTTAATATPAPSSAKWILWLAVLAMLAALVAVWLNRT